MHQSLDWVNSTFQQYAMHKKYQIFGIEESCHQIQCLHSVPELKSALIKIRYSHSGRNNDADQSSHMLTIATCDLFNELDKSVKHVAPMQFWMEAQLNRPVLFRDLYESVHKRKNREYVTQRSKNFIDSYDTTMLEKYGEDSSLHPMVDQEAWLEVTGPSKKGRVHGMSHSLDIGMHGSSFVSSSQFVGPSHVAIKEAVNEVMTSFVQTQLVSLIQTQMTSLLEPILRIVGFQIGSVVRKLHHEATQLGRIMKLMIMELT